MFTVAIGDSVLLTNGSFIDIALIDGRDVWRTDSRVRAQRVVARWPPDRGVYVTYWPLRFEEPSLELMP